MSSGKLTKSSYDKQLAGVCGGLADYFDLDPTLVRVGYAIFSFFSVGTGVILYIILAVIMPDA